MCRISKIFQKMMNMKKIKNIFTTMEKNKKSQKNKKREQNAKKRKMKK